MVWEAGKVTTRPTRLLQGTSYVPHFWICRDGHGLGVILEVDAQAHPFRSKRFETQKTSTLSYALTVFSDDQNFPGKQVDSEEWYQETG